MRELKKRLGQYFSGSKVANLLTFLCKPDKNASALDPMAGSGDMLASLEALGLKDVHGIEIDPDVIGDHPSIVLGDAFSLSSYQPFHRMSWDLVITNPPYVRYQSATESKSSEIVLKNSTQIREGLIEAIKAIPHLDSQDRPLFEKAARAYSGLADLAVPSWILCAALTAPGGTLAMVVPEAWMSRDYAAAIRILLRKLFEIKCVVEDAGAVWFPEAQVKTCLMVAKRIPLQSGMENRSHCRLRLYAGSKSSKSLVGNISYHGLKAEEALEAMMQAGETEKSHNFDLSVAAMEEESWPSKALSKLAASFGLDTGSAKAMPPRDVCEAIEISDLKLSNLAGWGIEAGQGLRTGFNKFFYVDIIDSSSLLSSVRADDIFQEPPFPISSRHIQPVLRHLSEAGSACAVTKGLLSGRVLCIKEDLSQTNMQSMQSMPRDLELLRHIAKAESMLFESGSRMIHIQDFSAVKPNIKLSKDGKIIRQWYMLPPLAKRHLPKFCVPRVNHKSARGLLVEDGIVVDANFTTFWTDAKDLKRIYAFLAILNSSWTQASLESIASVMGGGALKVEASHFAKLLLPELSIELEAALSPLGERMALNGVTEELVMEVDAALLGQMGGGSDSVENLRALRLSRMNARLRKTP
ncbi:MAG: SAM-dependent methyltransferase [Clostridiales bacterium]|jgi:hypothetical protein|nr:SAM-dependent methyltransferase [Clostridiales bacterium]